MSRHVTFCFAMLTVLVLTGGCGSGPDVPSSNAGALSSQGEQAYRSGNYAEAERLFGDMLASERNGAQAARARYWHGMSLLALGRSDDARAELKAASESTNDDVLRAMCLRGIGKSLFADRRYQDAEDVWRKLLSKYGRSIDGAEVLRLMEESARQRGDSNAAKRYHDELVKRFPNNPYATATVSTDPAFRQEGSGGNGTFTVQAGIFGDRSRAEALVSKIKARGIEAVAVSSGSGYAVRCGTFSTRSAALQRKAKLADAGFPSIIKD